MESKDRLNLHRISDFSCCSWGEWASDLEERHPMTDLQQPCLTILLLTKKTKVDDYIGTDLVDQSSSEYLQIESPIVTKVQKEYDVIQSHSFHYISIQSSRLVQIFDDCHFFFPSILGR